MDREKEEKNERRENSGIFMIARKVHTFPLYLLFKRLSTNGGGEGWGYAGRGGGQAKSVLGNIVLNLNLQIL